MKTYYNYLFVHDEMNNWMHLTDTYDLEIIKAGTYVGIKKWCILTAQNVSIVSMMFYILGR